MLSWWFQPNRPPGCSRGVARCAQQSFGTTPGANTLGSQRHPAGAGSWLRDGPMTQATQRLEVRCNRATRNLSQIPTRWNFAKMITTCNTERFQKISHYVGTAQTSDGESGCYTNLTQLLWILFASKSSSKPVETPKHRNASPRRPLPPKCCAPCGHCRCPAT